MIKRLFSIISCFVNAHFAFAQVDSLTLSTAVVCVDRKITTNQIDSIENKSQNLGNLLTEQSTVFVKTNAGAGLSSLSVRGGTAEQTAVFWNGININSQLNGNIDASLLTNAAFSDVEVNNLQSSNAGSGVIAGSINLKSNDFDTSKIGYASVDIGSFNRRSYMAGYGLKSKTTLSKLTIYHQNQENNYSYQPTDFARTNMLEYLDNAKLSSTGVVLNHRFYFKKMNPITFRCWAQSTDRQIPATMLESISQKNQQDKFVRMQADWSKTIKKSTLKLNVANVYEELNYEDRLSKLKAVYHSNNQFFISNFSKEISEKTILSVDVEARHFMANADSFYTKNRTEISQSVHLHQYFYQKRLKFHSSIRAVQYIQNQGFPVLYSLIVEYKINPNAFLIGNNSSNYRMPTFNQLYWRPGGNADLIPETSNNSELAFYHKKKNEKLRLSLFYNQITNQIRWLPNQTGIFTAMQTGDIKTINSGAEASFSKQYKWFSILFNEIFVHSTDSFLKGKQQSFAPLFQSNATIKFDVTRLINSQTKNLIRRGELTLNLNSWFISRRYTNTENTDWLPSVWVQNIEIEKSWKHLSLTVSAANFLNNYYTIMPYMPNMPRNFNFKLTYNLSKKIKQ